jgi:hypothetical protein
MAQDTKHFYFFLYYTNYEIPNQNSNDVFHRTRKHHPKVNMEAQRSQTIQAILSKESNTRGTIILDFKLYYRATATKTA